MTVAPPGIGPALADLAKLIALPLPTGGVEPLATARPADQLALMPPPTVTELRELAAAGLQQLKALLPMLARTVQNDAAEKLPLGHLARATGDAAHWIEAGYDGMTLKAEDIMPGWLHAARETLQETSDLLGRAQHSLDASPQSPMQPDRAANPELLWAMSQVLGAQRHVGTALGKLTLRPSDTLPIEGRASRSGGVDLRGAIVMLGLAMALILYAAASGMWLIAAGLGSMAVALAWGWRVVVTARGLRIELRR